MSRRAGFIIDVATPWIAGGVIALVMGAACPQRFAAATTRARGPVPSAFTLPTRAVCVDAFAADSFAAGDVVIEPIAVAGPGDDVADGADDDRGAGAANDDVGALAPLAPLAPSAPLAPVAPSGPSGPLAVSVDRPGVISRDAVVAVVAGGGVVGVAASLQNPQMMWVFNDDGELRGVDFAGRLKAVLSLPQVFVAPEDLELGPCPDLSGPCIYVADVGDAFGERDIVSVYAVPEPFVGGDDDEKNDDNGTSADAAVATVDYPAMWVMHLQFPDDERVHASALAIAPDGASLILFEGGAPNARAFAADAPWAIVTDDGNDDNDGPLVLRLLGTIDDDDEVVSAQYHWSGQRVLVQGSGSMAEFAMQRGDSGLLDATLDPVALQRIDLGARPPRVVGYSHDGLGLVALTTGDDDDDDALDVLEVRCDGADAATRVGALKVNP